MEYEMDFSLFENIKLARLHLTNYLEKNEDQLSEKDLNYLQENILNRLNLIAKNYTVIE